MKRFMPKIPVRDVAMKKVDEQGQQRKKFMMQCASIIVKNWCYSMEDEAKQEKNRHQNVRYMFKVPFVRDSTMKAAEEQHHSKFIDRQYSMPRTAFVLTRGECAIYSGVPWLCRFV